MQTVLYCTVIVWALLARIIANFNVIRVSVEITEVTKEALTILILLLHEQRSLHC